MTEDDMVGWHHRRSGHEFPRSEVKPILSLHSPSKLRVLTTGQPGSL